jgi:hypothetical protein
MRASQSGLERGPYLFFGARVSIFIQTAASLHRPCRLVAASRRFVRGGAELRAADLLVLCSARRDTPTRVTWGDVIESLLGPALSETCGRVIAQRIWQSSFLTSKHSPGGPGSTNIAVIAGYGDRDACLASAHKANMMDSGL